MKSSFQGVQLRDLDDIDSTRDAIYNSTLQAFKQLQPVSNTRYQLDLSDIGYQGRDRYSRAEENRAILEGRSLHRRLAGTWNLRDPNGQVLDSKRMTLANVPYLTSLGTYINNGSEYNLANQLRLRPGIFARQQANGELESHVNVSKGFGHKYYLDPETGVFRIQLHQSRMPLVPLLKTLGASDDQIRQAWGNELWSANAGKQDPTVIKKIFQKIYQGKAPGDEASMAEAVRKAFGEIELDPDVTQQTLGKPYSKLDVNAILDATKKLLAVQRGEAETDDRDAMQYQKIMTAEDLFADRVKQARKLMHSGLWKATNQGNLKRISPAYFDKMLRGTILDTGLGQGADRSPRQILEPAADVCSAKSPQIGLSQGFDAETLVLTSRGFILWPEVVKSDKLACQIDGKLTYARPIKLLQTPFTGELYGCQTKVFSYLVTSDQFLWCKAKPHGVYRQELAHDAFGKERRFATSLPELNHPTDGDFVLPAVVNERWSHEMKPIQVPGDLWAEFLGWFVAEGWVSDEAAGQGRGARSRVCLAQCPEANPEGHADIERVLSALPFAWNYNRSNKTFLIANKQLATELKKYGKGCANIRLPRYCFAWSKTRLDLLAQAYLRGDGNDYHGYVKCETTSFNLALDLVELFGRLGKTGRISCRPLSERNANWKDSYVISLGKKAEAIATSDSTAATGKNPPSHFKQPYAGKVYGAQVPGGLVYVLRDGKPHWSGGVTALVRPMVRAQMTDN